MIEPALALLEFSSVATGIRAGDAMVKRAPLKVVYSGTVHPGRYLLLIGGDVAEVEESLQAGRDAGAPHLIGEIFLPAVHPDVVAAIGGSRAGVAGAALGVIETTTVAAIIGAADAGIKGAEVELLEIQLADGLGGKGYTLFSGEVAEVEAAVEAGVETLADPRLLVSRVVIPQIHPEMIENLHHHPQFRALVDRGVGKRP